MSYVAYGRTQNRVENGRQIEYRLLGQVTGALIAVQHETDKRKFFDAVMWNQRVWDAFLHDLSDPENRLPESLKQQIISLCLWVRRETDAIIDGKSPVDALIKVNRNIMDGLR